MGNFIASFATPSILCLNMEIFYHSLLFLFQFMVSLLQVTCMLAWVEFITFPLTYLYKCHNLFNS